MTSVRPLLLLNLPGRLRVHSLSQSIAVTVSNSTERKSCDSLAGQYMCFYVGNLTLNLSSALRGFDILSLMCAHTLPLSSPSTPQDNKNPKDLTKNESSLDMLLHKSPAFSSTSWHGTVWCAVGKAVCSLLMMAVDSEMRHSRWDSGTQFSKSVP